MHRVLSGARLRVDLPKREVRLNGKLVPLDPQPELSPPQSLPEALDVLHQLYHDYKHSRPTERSMQDRHPYFRALPLGQLSDDDMNFSESRDICKARLELSMLSYLLTGLLHWDEDLMGRGWFYAHPKDKDFIIRRKWIASPL